MCVNESVRCIPTGSAGVGVGGAWSVLVHVCACSFMR